MGYNIPDIQGWTHDCELQFLYDIAKTLQNGACVVEIGCWKGRSSHAIASGIRDSGKNINLTCIDTFAGAITNAAQQERAKQENVKAIFENNMKEFSFDTFVGNSVDFAQCFKDNETDFLFLDGNHDYEFVINDINAWFPKVKVGGIFCGHDYRTGYKGVKKAVDEFFVNYTIELIPDSIFLVRKL